MLLRLWPKEIESLGLSFAGFDLGRQNVVQATNRKRFRDAFGVDPSVAADVYWDIHMLLTPAITGIKKPNSKYFFMMLN